MAQGNTRSTGVKASEGDGARYCGMQKRRLGLTCEPGELRFGGVLEGHPEIEVADEAVEVVGMNAKEFGRLGKAAAGLFESAQNQLFFQTANGFVMPLEGFRPIDKDPVTGNSEFLIGPFRAASLDCTVRGSATDLLAGKTGLRKGGILTPTADSGHLKKSIRKDSATIRMVRFLGGVPRGAKEMRGDSRYVFSFPPLTRFREE